MLMWCGVVWCVEGLCGLGETFLGPMPGQSAICSALAPITPATVCEQYSQQWRCSDGGVYSG